MRVGIFEELEIFVRNTLSFVFIVNHNFGLMWIVALLTIMLHLLIFI